MQILEVTRQIPMIGEYDVVICGGGPAGVMAALAATRQGARTALIERYGFVGGMATAGLVAPISVFRYNGEQVVGGIPWEFIQQLVAEKGAEVEYPLGNISFAPEKYKLVAQRMLLEAGVTLYLHAFLSDCRQNGSRITHVVFESKSGAQAIAAKCFVDCTGDGDLAKMAGVPLQPRSGALQPASLIFCLANVETDHIEKIHHSQQGVNYHIEPLRDLLRKIAEKEQVPNFGGPWMCWMMTPGFVLVNMTRIEANMIDEREQTRAECQLREDAHRLTDLLRRHAEPFRNAVLIATAVQAGVRETRRIQGVHTLTGAEYVNSVQFVDTIARGAHPIDIHTANDSSQTCVFLKEAANIPYRTLIASGYPNLIAAGRCFSADREASASVRVMGSVMGLGQAAGLAAALAIQGDNDVTAIDINRLRQLLLDLGAYI